MLSLKNRLRPLFIEDRYVALVISLNALVLFLLSFEPLEANPWLARLDAIFLVYFIIEAALKINLYGWKRYISSGWNRFDFTIVVLSIPSLVLLFEANLSDFAFIFVFRIIRVVRFFKFIKFIPNIHELIAGVKRAFKASIFVLAAFFIYSFIISLVSCRVFAKVSPELFGDPVSAFYHTFKVFTIEGWYDVPETIIEQAELGMLAGFFTKLYFIIIVVTGGLFGLSIVNAIFVEEMVRDNNDDLRVQITDMDRKLDALLAQQKKKPSPPLSSGDKESPD